MSLNIVVYGSVLHKVHYIFMTVFLIYFEFFHISFIIRVWLRKCILMLRCLLVFQVQLNVDLLNLKFSDITSIELHVSNVGRWPVLTKLLHVNLSAKILVLKRQLFWILFA